MGGMYKTKKSKIRGTSYSEIERTARKSYSTIAAKSKRSPYIRSAFFKKEKVFISLFWTHLNQKNRKDRKRRLQYLICAFDLIANSKLQPSAKLNPNGDKTKVYRFCGVTYDNEIFYVQIKEDRFVRKFFISLFPYS